MKTDDYSEVLNAPETFEEIADVLKAGSACFIGWTDEQSTHFDILFTFRSRGFGTHQGGVRPMDLFVSIMRLGAFGFEIEHTDTHPEYYAEKLHCGGGATAVALAELINGVKKELLK